MPSLIRVKYVFVRTFFTLMLRNFCVIFTDHHADIGACLVLIYHYGGKKTKDRNLNCRCHLNDITRDSIFYDIVGLGATWIFFRFFQGSSTQKRWVIFYHYNTKIVVNLKLYITEQGRWHRLSSMRFHSSNKFDYLYQFLNPCF